MDEQINKKDQCCCEHEHQNENHNHQEHEEHCHCHNHKHEHEHSHHHHDDGLHCSCGCHDDHDDEESPLKKIIASAILFVLALLLDHINVFPAAQKFLTGFGLTDAIIKIICQVIYFISYITIGLGVIRGAIRNIKNGNIFGEQFLMSVASIGAIFAGEFPEAVAVMLFYMVGEIFQDYAVDKSKDSITALMDIRPDHANLLDGNSIKKVSPEDVNINDIIEVLPGERIPLDGIIIEGSSFADTSALTGESLPREISAKNNDEVLAGFINQSGLLRIKVTKLYTESAVSRILTLTQEASSVKAKSEKFISKFARVYTPVVCIAAVLVAVIPPLFLKFFNPALFIEYGWSVWVYRALSFLVVSCPCALVISVPLAFFCGIGLASKNGILVKGSNYIEALSKNQTAVFDKTGTLTKGSFTVSKIIPYTGFTSEEILSAATHAEYYSTHPISASLKEAHSCELCNSLKIENTEEIAGHGIRTVVFNKQITIGNSKLMIRDNIKNFKEPEEAIAGTIIHVAINNEYAGYIIISDTEKEDSRETITLLKKLGVKKTVMLTGDSESTARVIAGNLGLDEYYAELLPEGKVQIVEKLIKEQTNDSCSDSKILFAGDGVNDSPVLARADVGVAMGALGSDAAIEAADVVIMDDKPSRLIDAIKISRKTMNVVFQNIYISIGVKVLIMILNAVGIGNMWLAVFGDVGVTFLAILNSAKMSYCKL